MSFFSSHISSSSKIFYFTRGVSSAIAGLPESPEYALLHTHGIVAAPFFAFCRWKGRHDTSIFLLNVSTHPLPLSSKLTWLLSILNLSAAFACRLYDDSGLCLCMMQFVSSYSYQDYWFAR